MNVWLRRNPNSMMNQDPLEIRNFLNDLIALKQELLRREDNGQVKLTVHPITISDMLNEAFEYLSVLESRADP